VKEGRKEREKKKGRKKVMNKKVMVEKKVKPITKNHGMWIASTSIFMIALVYLNHLVETSIYLFVMFLAGIYIATSSINQ
jgi:hypothetical protein